MCMAQWDPYACRASSVEQPTLAALHGSRGVWLLCMTWQQTIIECCEDKTDCQQGMCSLCRWCCWSPLALA